MFVDAALTSNEPQHCVDEKMYFFLLLHLFCDTFFVSANYCGVSNAFIVAKADMRTKHIVLRIRESSVYNFIGVEISKKKYYSQFGSAPRSDMHQARRSTCFRQGKCRGTVWFCPQNFGLQFACRRQACTVMKWRYPWHLSWWPCRQRDGRVNVEGKKSPPMCHPGWPKVQLLEVKNARNAAADSQQIFTQMFCGTVVVDRRLQWKSNGARGKKNRF